MSPGKISPLTKENGNPYMNGLALIETREINGVDQSMIIRSKNVDNPVLLYVHGGPGSPEFPFIKHMKTDLEEYFTVCYWEQRGAGLSWSKDIPEETMTLKQFVEDTRVVTEYLIDKFGKDKIFILGHSWGTMLASYTIKKYPQLYHAYFGVAQVADQLRAEEISYDFVMEEARKRNDKKAVKVLEEIGKPPYSSGEEWVSAIMKERKYVSKYGGAIKEGNFMKMAITAMVNCREYKLKDKFAYIKGNNRSMQLMWREVLENNLMEDLQSQEIPVYIFQGKHDYQVTYEVGRDYYDILEAPEKEFFTFENSAHSPNFEEKEKFEEIIGGLVERVTQSTTENKVATDSLI
jgi:pimeloyl-ACP methyl ester carboxylesterase